MKVKTNELHAAFAEKEKMIFRNDSSPSQSEIDQLSPAELLGLINERKDQVHWLADEFNDRLKSHGENVDAGYREIMNLNLDFMMSIK